MIAIAVLLTAAVQPDVPPASQRNFVSCPIVQDTRTVPCWLSEYEGELYYLGIQTDISADFDPPYLGHQVLVEGTLSDEPRICGGLVLTPVMVSPLPELDLSCDTIRPAVEAFTVPFAPRPPGPSGGRLAFQAPPAAPQDLAPPPAPDAFDLYYDVDMLVMGRHAGVLRRIFTAAQTSDAPRLTVIGHRGATMLSDGRLLTERSGIAQARAEEVAALLKDAGLTDVAIDVTWQDTPEAADGAEDWRSRRTTVRVANSRQGLDRDLTGIRTETPR